MASLVEQQPSSVLTGFFITCFICLSSLAKTFYVIASLAFLPPSPHVLYCYLASDPPMDFLYQAVRRCLENWSCASLLAFLLPAALALSYVVAMLTISASPPHPHLRPPTSLASLLVTSSNTTSCFVWVTVRPWPASAQQGTKSIKTSYAYCCWARSSSFPSTKWNLTEQLWFGAC